MSIERRVKISVIVPVYNVKQYLRECLNSIINQSLKDIEIFCIDDGSTDKSRKILDEYASKDSRIKVIHKENEGYGKAMNVGLSHATGEYIGIVEPDDYIALNMYDDLYNIAKKYNSDIVKSCFYDNLQTKEEQRILKTPWEHEKIPQNRSFKISECGLFLYYHPSIWSCIYKKEFLDKHKIRFIEAPGAGWTDNPFQVQTMCLAERINYTSKAYYYWRRIHSCNSDALRDYRIPFLRSREIHEWLEKNNINNEVIMNNLLCRELAYINIVFKMKKLENLRDCLEQTKGLLKRFDEESFLKASYIKDTNKRTFKRIKKHPIIYLGKTYFKRKRQKFISFRWGSKERKIILFGKILYQRQRQIIK